MSSLPAYFALPCILLFSMSTISCRQERAPTTYDPFDPATVADAMVRSTQWQLAHPRHPLWDWTNGAFYAGVTAAYESTLEPWILDSLLAMGNRNRWLPGPRYRLADDHAIAQTYLDLSRITGDSTFYAAFRDTADRVISRAPNWTESYQVIDYWWCDALFMSPPALAKLAAATGDHRYLVLMDRLWGETYDLLYDRDERLFSRDIRYKIQPDGSGPRERNGEKIFWSRGNGWVLAGTARLIDALPSSFENREFYVGVFREMASRIAELQPADGLWRPSLLDPQSFPSGESSGSGFFCFALAWGINNDILDRPTFLPVVRSSWPALLANLDENGRLGFVQRIGEKPEMISPDDWEVYGTGAFLLAAGEILKLQRGVETGIR